MKFRAFRVSEQLNEEGQSYFETAIQLCETDDLPAGEVLIKVAYSSLNFKDALSASGNKGVTRTYPHTPGIDAAGVVAASDSPLFAVGDEVIVTGYDLGMNTAGGLGEYIRVPAQWCVRRPEALTLKESMIWGTAGITAALSVNKLLQRGLTPDKGEVLVTGASGGVGSVAVALLAKLGFSVVAVSGKAEAGDYCSALGASRVVRRDAIAESNKPLLKEQWAAAIDCVGGEALGSVIKQLKAGGVVTTCGLTAGTNFNATVFPFILRGVELLGIDSVEIPIELKSEMWSKIAGEWRISWPDTAVTEVSLDEVAPYLDAILAGQQYGRVIVVHKK
ncbi:MAG: YhdH/YhfP family quinone oxidoreductase [Hahellaceae bacterium]|nr:YhdH/YhfP family quinone oxidoreductase [Hahellaceae bacterium]